MFVSAAVQVNNHLGNTVIPRAVITVFIDGNFVQQGPVSRVGSSVNAQMGVVANWSGTLTAGTHTIEIRTSQNVVADSGVTYCTVGSRCSMDVLQFK